MCVMWSKFGRSHSTMVFCLCRPVMPGHAEEISFGIHMPISDEGQLQKYICVNKHRKFDVQIAHTNRLNTYIRDGQSHLKQRLFYSTLPSALRVSVTLFSYVLRNGNARQKFSLFLCVAFFLPTLIQIIIIIVIIITIANKTAQQHASIINGDGDDL